MHTYLFIHKFIYKYLRQSHLNSLTINITNSCENITALPWMLKSKSTVVYYLINV